VKDVPAGTSGRAARSTRGGRGRSAPPGRTASGPRPSEVRSHAGVLTPEQRAQRLAEKLARWLGLTRDLPRTSLTLTRGQVEALRSLLGDHMQSLASRLHDAERRIAEARRAYLASDGDAGARASGALQAVLLDLPRDGHEPQLDAAKVADDFRALVENEGTVVLWNSIELALDLPGLAVEGCPLSPDDAVAVLTQRYGFATSRDCLRFLQRERAYRAQDEDDEPPFVDDPVLTALRRLP